MFTATMCICKAAVGNDYNGFYILCIVKTPIKKEEKQKRYVNQLDVEP